jgi:hypothetical protein
MFVAKHIMLGLVFVFPVQSYAQNSKPPDVFGPVLVNERAHLSKRLNLFVELNRRRQWAKLYGMLSKSYISPDETREHFIKQMNATQTMRVLAFVPEYSTRNYTIGADYLIDGCAKTRWKGNVAWYKMGLGAILENHEWYFTPIVITSQMGAPPEPCNPLAASNKSLDASGGSVFRN